MASNEFERRDSSTLSSLNRHENSSRRWRSNLLVHVSLDVSHTIRSVSLRTKLVGMPNKINVEGWHKKRARRARHEVQESVVLGDKRNKGLTEMNPTYAWYLATQ